MRVYCIVCGKPLERAKPSRKNFCSAEHRNLWMSENIDFAKLARGHKAQHLTELNLQRNPLCHIADRGKANSRKARAAAEASLGRPLEKGEVVHHMNGDATDNRPENLLVMPDRQHRQLHMALAMEQMEGGDPDGK